MRTNSAIKLTQLQVSQLMLLVKEHKAFHNFCMYDDVFLYNAVQRRIKEKKCVLFEEYLNLLTGDQNEASLLIRSLQNNYSEFFRNSLTFSVLERILLPLLIHRERGARQKEIRIWSAACASGQEAYSLAILMEELIGENNTFSYRIFATDVDELQINKARKGEYFPEAIGNLTVNRVKRWFSKQGSSYTVKEELKRHIDFSVFDLASIQYNSPPASIFGGFDLIFCANLLFYFKDEYQESILRKVGNNLAAGGYLITGESEREIVLSHKYHEVFPQSAIFIR